MLLEGISWGNQTQFSPNKSTKLSMGDAFERADSFGLFEIKLITEVSKGKSHPKFCNQDLVTFNMKCITVKNKSGMHWCKNLHLFTITKPIRFLQHG